MSIETTRKVRRAQPAQSLPDPVLESGFEAITTLTGLLRADVEHATARVGLSQPMAAALGRLVHLPEPSTVGALARSLGCNMGNLSGTLDRLEEAGYIERTVGDSDRRARFLRVTPKGWKTKALLTQNFQLGRVCSALKELSVSELETLTKMIGHLNAVAKTERPT
jgi:DNA-binding MarR family transcriptional regulator